MVTVQHYIFRLLLLIYFKIFVLLLSVVFLDFLFMDVYNWFEDAILEVACV